MALTANDLIYPSGDLLPSMFPNGDIATVVPIWLTEAVGKTALEQAQRHWVYYRAYAVIANRIASTPSSENSFSNHAISWGSDRVTHFQEMADAQLAEYNRLTGGDMLNSKQPAGFKVY